jgi:hypothetical protein
MTAKHFGNVYVGRYGSASPRNAGTVALHHGVPRVGDTIALPDGKFWVTHVHRNMSEGRHGKSKGTVELYVEPVEAGLRIRQRNRYREAVGGR